MPRVHNLATEGGRAALRAGAVYVGRPGPYGNPFVIGRDGDRDEVIAKYADWLATQPGLIARAQRELAGKDLVCFCAPKPCHGDVLMAIANEPALDREAPVAADRPTRSMSMPGAAR